MAYAKAVEQHGNFVLFKEAEKRKREGMRKMLAVALIISVLVCFILIKISKYWSWLFPLV
jgi:hypothetical protein